MIPYSLYTLASWSTPTVITIVAARIALILVSSFTSAISNIYVTIMLTRCCTIDKYMLVVALVIIFELGALTKKPHVL